MVWDSHSLLRPGCGRAQLQLAGQVAGGRRGGPAEVINTQRKSASLEPKVILRTELYTHTPTKLYSLIRRGPPATLD